MQGDLKEVVGTLMRVLDGTRISREEVEELAFEAGGELRNALNEAYLRLLEYADDCDAGLKPPTRSEMRRKLQHSLDEIVRLADEPAT